MRNFYVQSLFCRNAIWHILLYIGIYVCFVHDSFAYSIKYISDIKRKYMWWYHMFFWYLIFPQFAPTYYLMFCEWMSFPSLKNYICMFDIIRQFIISYVYLVLYDMNYYHYTKILRQWKCTTAQNRVCDHWEKTSF